MRKYPKELSIILASFQPINSLI